MLKLRCFEEGRPDCEAKLKALGLSEYNPLEIVKKTHGVSFNDYIWIRFPGERLTAKDVLVRNIFSMSRDILMGDRDVGVKIIFMKERNS